VRAVPSLCGFYPGICLTTEEKARKNLSQGSPKLYFTPNIIRIVEKNEKDMASNMDVLEEKCIKSFCGEYHFENLGIYERTKV